MLELFPAAHVYYLGLFREKVTLQPVECTSLFYPSSTAKTPLTITPFRLFKASKAAYC